MAEWADMQQGYDIFPWPDYVNRGLELFYGYAIPLEDLEAFLARWSGYPPSKISVEQAARKWQNMHLHHQSESGSFNIEVVAEIEPQAFEDLDAFENLREALGPAEWRIPIRELSFFAQRLRGLERKETYLHAFMDGQDEDRQLAMTVLGESDLPEVRGLLLPLLHSPHPRERWLSAMGLGRMKEAEAFPVLCTILTEYLPSEASPFPVEDQYWYDEQRYRARNILSSWEDSALPAIFRQALAATVQAEQYIPAHPDRGAQKNQMYNWYHYQDGLISALGAWGAFGALLGIPLSPRRLRLAIVDMVIACRQSGKYRFEMWDRYPWRHQQELRKEMMTLLGQQFGLSESEQNRYLDDYGKDESARDNLVAE